MATSQDTVLIAEEDSKTFDELDRLITQAGFKVLRCQHWETLHQVERSRQFPCVLILGDTVGLDFLEQLRASHWEMPVIVLHSTSSISSAVQAIRAGAEDYIPKPFCPDTLLDSIQRAMTKARERTAATQVNRELLERARTLTRREYDIIQHILAGRLNKHIAEELGLALVTVKVHRGSAMRKLGARTAGELAGIIRELSLSHPGGLPVPGAGSDSANNTPHPAPAAAPPPPAP